MSNLKRSVTQIYNSARSNPLVKDDLILSQVMLGGNKGEVSVPRVSGAGRVAVQSAIAF